MKYFSCKNFLLSVIILVIIWLCVSYFLQKELVKIYQDNQSVTILDRHGKIIAILSNQKGYYAYYSDSPPERFKQLLIQNEDRFFYYHPGINPISILKDLFARAGVGKRKASSTITQQLVKNLLGNELKRGIKPRIKEVFYVFALETWHSKKEILKMYTNSIYFGNQIQGVYEASQYYFNLPPELLSDAQILQLLATISSPTKNNPKKEENIKIARLIAKKLNLKINEKDFFFPKEIKKNIKNHSFYQKSYFEISDFVKDFSNKKIETTTDLFLAEKIREIVKRNIQELKTKNAKNAAVIVIKLPENELLANIGSPNPYSFEEGYKINMALQPRPVGSTIKPFIYLKAFEKGLRPYTLVEDREYKYITALGFPLYPKNFDYKYRGTITLHYALSNSLNVPAVKVLEYIGSEDFYRFLKKDLEFVPVQSLNNYQLGIALGALEMSLFDLSKYFTIFPNEGVLREIKITKSNQQEKEKKISEKKYIQLINKILSDRKTGVEQFGIKSELNLFYKNYALKTGTSRDFKDSWIVGYTPDFLVGVWVGNADNSPTLGLSGQIGAGRIWNETMELLLNSNYNKKTPFDFSEIKEFQKGEKIEYGLSSDNYEKIKNILIERDDSLILSPHQDDRFFLEENAKIILKSREEVLWYVNNDFLANGKEIVFTPKKAGVYKIIVKSQTKEEEVQIFVVD